MASGQPRKLKGILKQAKSSASAPPPPSSTPPLATTATASLSKTKTTAEAEQIALQHARIIQQQKNLELEILEAVVALCSFPTVDQNLDSSSSKLAPAPSDVVQFKRLVRQFQPGDYDNLIEERNILNLCGYALCPRPRRSIQGGGKYKLVNKNKQNFDIVPREELEKWCSDQCARRALYIKVQLSETAAWERIGIPNLSIDLLEEEEEKETERGSSSNEVLTKLAKDVARLKLDEERKAAGDSIALSLERGDGGRVSLGRIVDVTIREKSVTAVPKPPEQHAASSSDASHLILEGHKIRFGNTSDMER